MILRNFFLVIVFLFGLCFIKCGNEETDTTVPSWKIVGDRGFSEGAAYSSVIGLDSTGNPIVAYRDEANNSKLTVKKYDGSKWQTLGSRGFSEGDVYQLSIDVDGDTPYVAYKDGASTAAGKVSVMKFTNNSWDFVGNQGFSIYSSPDDTVAFSYGNRRISISVVNDSAIFLAYINSTNQTGPYVYKFDGASWSNVSAGLTTGENTDDVSIFAESACSVYLAYRHDYNGFVQKFNGSSWEATGTDGGSFTAQGGRSFSITVNNGVPYVAYCAIDGEVDTGGDNNFDPDKAVVKSFDGTEWIIVGEAISSGAATEITMCFDSNNDAVICYMDWNGVGGPTIERRGNSVWSILGKAGIVAVGTHFISMDVHNAQPFVAFIENEGAYEGKVSALKYD